jgi:hypothetical protein
LQQQGKGLHHQATEILQQSIQVAASIQDTSLRDLTKWDIENTKAAAVALKLTLANADDQAIAIAAAIPKEDEREATFAQIALHQAQQDRLDQCIRASC